MIAAAVFRLHLERPRVYILLTEMVPFKVIGRHFGATSRSFHFLREKITRQIRHHPKAETEFRNRVAIPSGADLCGMSFDCSQSVANAVDTRRHTRTR